MNPLPPKPIGFAEGSSWPAAARAPTRGATL
jgi:hypothetical protein